MKIKNLFALCLPVMILFLVIHMPIPGDVHSKDNKQVQSYSSADAGTYSYHRLRIHSTIKKGVSEQIHLHPVLIFCVIPLIAKLTFDISKIFFDIPHVPVYHWQLARGDLSEKSCLSY